jgi:putative zinc finger protein
MTEAKRLDAGSNDWEREAGHHPTDRHPSVPPDVPIPDSSALTDPTRQPDDDFLSCVEAIDLMGLYLAHELGVRQRDRFVNHIRSCSACHEKLLALEIYLHVGAKRHSQNEA